MSIDTPLAGGLEPVAAIGDAVTVEQLSISYRAGRELVPVATEVSFTIAEGQTFGLVGESGSGKSTVARTLLAQLRAGSQVTGGQVRVAGQDVFGLDPARLRALRGGTVALVAQNAGQSLTPSMRVGTQIHEAMTSHGLRASRADVLRALDQVRLPNVKDLARRYPHELSGGQQQRVGIAMAIAARPSVLVLDEPTTALDVVTQAAVLRLIKDLSRELQTATLIVSHDLGVVSGMADHVAVMRAGRILESRPTAELFTAPGHEYTRQLLSDVPTLGARSRTASVAPAAGAGQEPEPPADTRNRGSDVLLSCENVSISYHASGPPAVDSVDLEIRRGETLAIVGESGSGKSTLAWSLAGLAAPSSGTMRVHGDSVTGTGGDLARPVARRSRELRQMVQLIFQNADTSLNPRRTIAAAIRRPLRLFGTVARAEERRRVEELLTEVGLPASFGKRLPAQLSGGQRQRVGIARALAAAPELIIADEITTALDVSVQADILELLSGLQESHGLSTLFISHDLAVVADVADRVMVMKNGRVVEIGDVADVFSGPNHPYTASLLDAVLEPGVLELPQSPAEEQTWIDDNPGGWFEPSPGHLIRKWKGTGNR
ncbi:ABC transporter ATP-binding protein [Paeniglutamicibacter psychrophenolicus]|uniref:Peptide/nickel transport system ATP-binding protein n=1 Tax=Paeniglutamicibacter psychrophenolicus TaxID=257454 RepID=A0ABS4WG06_9MICC|nr:ABC transporter ATP-binding protein [Paeniglutamicibacter psychrophenolicus]MBP2375133.1 peptide/nickel transport system ATP-binding protein [Paeniglutamicibacter psychrophenolicus]